LGKKVFKKPKRVARAEYIPEKASKINTNLTVPRHICKKVNKITICATLCHHNSTPWHTYYSLIPTLLAYFWHCATCATSFFLSLKKKFAQKFHYSVAHLE
jgi:hypothetical protein